MNFAVRIVPLPCSDAVEYQAIYCIAISSAVIGSIDKKLTLTDLLHYISNR